MRKLLLAAIAALLAAGSAGAIINGEPDGNRHPYVGVIGFLNPDGSQGVLCSGTLISPTVVLTAGHCTYRSPAGFVWFTPQAFAGPPVVGRPVTHPDFDPELNTPNSGDMGVVLLSRAVPMQTYGALPTAGYLDSFSSKKGQQNRDVTVVGYGLQSVKPDLFTGERMLGRAQIRNINNSTVRDFGLQTSSSACSGDSGGPVLHGDSNLVLAVTSFGKNANCVGNVYSYRTDSAAARAFLDDFVPVP